MNPYKRPQLPPPEGLREATRSLREQNDKRAAAFAGAELVTHTRSGRLDPDQESAREEIHRAGEFILGELGKLRDSEGNMHGVPTDVRHVIDSAEILIGGMVEFSKALASRSSSGRREGIAAMHEAIASLKRYQGDNR